MYKIYGNVLSTGTKERTIEVLGGFGHSRISVGVCVCAFVCISENFLKRVKIGIEAFLVMSFPP